MTDDPGTPPDKRHWIPMDEILGLGGATVLVRTREEHLQGCTWFRVTEVNRQGAWMEGWIVRPDLESDPPTDAEVVGYGSSGS